PPRPDAYAGEGRVVTAHPRRTLGVKSSQGHHEEPALRRASFAMVGERRQHTHPGRVRNVRLEAQTRKPRLLARFLALRVPLLSRYLSVTTLAEIVVFKHERGFLEADDGVRTRDPQLGKLMLYQLSYVRAG